MCLWKPETGSLSPGDAKTAQRHVACPWPACRMESRRKLRSIGLTRAGHARFLGEVQGQDEVTGLSTLLSTPALPQALTKSHQKYVRLLSM